jgi:uncharacterized membrane protein
MGFLGTSVIGWTVFGIFGFPWLLILSAFALMNLLRTLAGKSEIVAGEVRRLERKQAKEIQARNKKNQPGP